VSARDKLLGTGALAALIVVATALFAVGVTIERNQEPAGAHAESTEGSEAAESHEAVAGVDAESPG
jgi:hypothetical protein